MLHCHAGCPLEAILGALDLKKADLFPPSNRNGKPEVVATYDYCDEQGAVLFQVCRTLPKGFFQRRPDGRGGWINNLRNTRKVPFHLPEFLAADPSQAVFVVEGEKDALAVEALGLVATCSPGGVAKWKMEYSSLLRDRIVILLPDNDPPGEKHMEEVLESVRHHAAEVKVLRLPDLPPKGDVSDWIASGGDRARLLQLVQETSPEPEPTQALPEILTSHRQLREMTGEVLESLYRKNDPPRLFVRGGLICRVRQDEQGRPIIEELSDHALRGEMERAANFIRDTKTGRQPIPPPMTVVKDVQSRPGWRFPPLEGVIRAPVLRPDGSILDQAGYDGATRLVYWPATDLEIPRIPDRPATEEVQSALGLVNEAIADFPFADDASHANTLALFLTPIVRPAIQGPVPLAVCDAPQKGTGKSLLMEVAGTIATGRGEHMGGPKREEEWQKVLTATLVEGTPFVILDNLRGTIRSAALERVLTAEYWSDRILGHTKMARLPQRATWAATANNAQLGGDLARRCYWIRLDAQRARPWTRTDFQHPQLHAWVAESRGRLLAALLTLARAWFASGCPRATTPPLGKFEEWVTTVGGILAHAGVQGFLGNQEALYTEMDEEDSEWEAFLRAWTEAFEDKVVAVSDLVEEMFPENGSQSKGGELLQAALPSDLVDTPSPGELGRRRTSFSKRLGKAISNRKERRYGDDGIRITPDRKDTHRRVKRWRVVKEAGLAGLAGLISPDGKTSAVTPGSDSSFGSVETNPRNPQTPQIPDPDPYEIEERRAIQEEAGEVIP